VSRGKVRRSRLFYLRTLKGRAARLTSEAVSEQNSAKDAGKTSKAKSIDK
jgi:hypothetical protein